MPPPRVVRRLLVSSVAMSVVASVALTSGVAGAAARPDPIRNGKLSVESVLVTGAGCASPQPETVAAHAAVSGNGTKVVRSLVRSAVVTNQADPADVLTMKSKSRESVTLTQAGGVPRSGHVAIQTTAAVDADLGQATQCETAGTAETLLTVTLKLRKPRRLHLDIIDRGAVFQVTLLHGQQHQILLADLAFDSSEHHDVVLSPGTWTLNALAGVVARAPSPFDLEHTRVTGAVSVDFTLGAL